jgi:Protein of unknown function (DUF4238)
LRLLLVIGSTDRIKSSPMKYKDNHIVPELILKNFRNEKGEFFYFSKLKPHKPIEHRNTSSVFVKRNLYISVDADGNRNTSLESVHFQKLENEVKPLIEKILLAARVKKTAKLSEGEKSIWDRFFTFQMKRSPEFHRIVPMMGSTYQAINWAVAEAEKEYGEVSDDIVNELLAEPNASRLHQEAKVRALGQDSPKTFEALANRGIAVCIPKKSNKSFVIGSQPIARVRHEGKTLADPEIAAFFPISFDVAVSPWGQRGTESLIGLDDSLVREINRTVLLNSDEIGSRSIELLRSLIAA